MKYAAFLIALLWQIHLFAEPGDHSDLMWFSSSENEHAAVTTADDWEQRRQQILIGMQAAMGPLPSRDNLPEFDIKIVDTLTGDGFHRDSITFVSEGTDRVSADLYFPTNNPADNQNANRNSLPAMLALHPTGALGKRIVAGGGPHANRQYAVELAQRGYVVIAPDYPSFGDYQYDFNSDAYDSGTMKGIFNHMRCVDVLIQEYKVVDPQRIGVIGHSLGGHNAMFLAAFDQRIKVIVSSCGWTPFHDYYNGNLKGWTSDRYMPLLNIQYELNPDKVPFDFYEVVAALAPRPFFTSSPLEDENFSVQGVQKAIPKVREVYDLLHAGEHLKAVYPHCEHDFPTETREQAYSFIDQALQHTPAQGLNYEAELPRIQPLEPDAALAAFEVAPGFKIQLVASEPLITDPVAMSFDEHGNLYVVEMRDYSEQEHDKLGRIRVLQDTNQDGVFDKSHVFADQLSWPTAIICSQRGVFVGAAPDILFLRDNNGDHQADEKKTVFTGFHRSNIQGLLNSFRWGIDNRIHGATSSSGGLVKRPEEIDSQAIDLRGRDFSFDPLKLDLRAEAGGAQHGLSFGDYGRKYVCSNSDHAQFVIYDDRSLASNPFVIAPPARVSIADDGGQAPVFRSSPIEPWRIVRTRLRVSGEVSGPIEGGGRPAGYFTGATGITIFRGDAWNEDDQGIAFIGDVGSNIVHRKRLTQQDVTYVASRIDEQSEFLRSKDIWFRPVQFANAPDGCLYILDMYREVIEHPKSLPPEIKQHLDLTSGQDRGRLYRILREKSQPRTSVNLSTKTGAELVQLLDHPNSWHRETAARLLHESFSQSPNLNQLLNEQAQTGSTPQGRLHALYLLESLDLLTAEHVARRLQDPSLDVVEHAIKLSGEFSEEHFAAELLEMFVFPPTFLRNPRLALQIALSANAFPEQKRIAIISQILQNKHVNQNQWVRAAALSALSSGAGKVFAEVLQNSEMLDSGVVRSLVQLIARQNNPNDIKVVLNTLQQNQANVRPLQSVLLLELLIYRPELKSQLQDQLKLILTEARSIAYASGQAFDKRVAAIQTLALSNYSDEEALLQNLLNQQQPTEVQSAALELLAGYGEVATTLILDDWNQFGPSLRLQAESILFSRPTSIALLFDRLESGQIAPSLISSAQLQVAVNHKDKLLQARAQQLLEKTSTRIDQALMQSYRDALQQAGDVSHGRTVFRKTCATCHQLENIGHALGPNLATMKNRGAESILLNVLDPNREVNPQYLSYVVSTIEGRTYTGMIKHETSNSLTLVRAEDKTDTIFRADIDQLKSTGLSLMPEDLHKTISPSQLSDVIAYLLTIQ